MYFNCTQQITVDRKRERDISVQLVMSSSRLTLCIAEAKDGSELTLLIVMEGESGGKIEKSPNDLLQQNILGYCQHNA